MLCLIVYKEVVVSLSQGQDMICLLMKMFLLLNIELMFVSLFVISMIYNSLATDIANLVCDQINYGKYLISLHGAFYCVKAN